MLSRTHRFHGSGSLRRVYSQGKTVRGPFFSIRWAPNDRRESYRVAVVVSRKVHKSAVGRNRMRRRIYASVRKLQRDINGPYDIVITVFQDSLLNEPPSELDKQVRTQLAAANLLRKV
jgi:ribonuclease P protein component